MDNNELNNNSSSLGGTYRATTNLNIDMENPQINVNSVVGVNIKDDDNSNFNNDSFSNGNMNQENYTNFGNVSNYLNESNNSFVISVYC